MKKYINLIEKAKKEGKDIPYWTTELFLLIDETKIIWVFFGILATVLVLGAGFGLPGLIKFYSWELTIFLAVYSLSFAIAITGMAWEDVVRERRGRKNLTLREIIKKEIDFEKECL